MRASGTLGRGLLLAALVGLVVPLAPGPAEAGHEGGELVIPVAQEGVTYRTPQGEDDGEWLGPPALAVAPDGTTWVDDLYANRLLRYAPDGTRLAPLDLTAHDVLSAVDLALGAGELFVLDVNPLVDRYRVLRLTPDGRRLGSYDIPDGYRLEDGLTGIAVDGDGSLLLELSGGARLVQLVDASGRLRVVQRDGYRVHGRRYVVEYPDAVFGPVTVLAGGVRVEIDADHDNGAVQFLGTTPSGDFFVAVEEVAFGDGRIRVDLTVRRYSAAGRFVAAARRELGGTQFTYVQRPFALHGDQVLELSTRRDEVTVAPMSFTPVPVPVLPATSVRRLTAVDAVDAALTLSRLAFPTGAGTALLARADDFADGLATGGLQGLRQAPLLLTPGDRLDGDVARELDRLGVTRVHVLGGPAAVSADVEAALRARGITTSRLAGRDRVETAAAVAAAAFPSAPVALLARGYAGTEPTQAFADALGVGAWAAERRWPTLLTRIDVLPTAVRDYLRAAGTRQVYVVGGPAAVSDAVVADLRRSGITVHRVAGADRAGTAVEIARHRGAPTIDEADSVLLLDGSSTSGWAPGVTSAAYAGRSGAQVVLGAGQSLPAATARWLDAATAPRPLLCGPFTTLGSCEAARAALGHVAG